MTARGDVWIARLDKLRPVIILTRDPMADVLNEILVVACTTTTRGLITEVPVGAFDGLQRDSVANTDAVQLIRQADLVRQLGHARLSTMDAICEALHYAIGC